MPEDVKMDKLPAARLSQRAQEFMSDIIDAEQTSKVDKIALYKELSAKIEKYSEDLYTERYFYYGEADLVDRLSKILGKKPSQDFMESLECQRTEPTPYSAGKMQVSSRAINTIRPQLLSAMRKHSGDAGAISPETMLEICAEFNGILPEQYLELSQYTSHTVFLGYYWCHSDPKKLSTIKKLHDLYKHFGGLLSFNAELSAAASARKIGLKDFDAYGDSAFWKPTRRNCHGILQTIADEHNYKPQLPMKYVVKTCVDWAKELEPTEYTQQGVAQAVRQAGYTTVYRLGCVVMAGKEK